MLFDANYNGRAVRLLGVSLNNTIDKKDYKEQLSIFDSSNDKTNNNDDDLDIILDDINKKFKKFYSKIGQVHTFNSLFFHMNKK